MYINAFLHVESIGSNFGAPWPGSPPTDRRDGKAVGLSDIYNLSGSVVLRNIEVQRCYGPALQFENWPNGQIR